jgi:hypothetical protein
MRPLNDLDAAIEASERGVATHRRNLEAALRDAEVRVKRNVASPKVLIGTVLAGYVVGRFIDRSRAQPALAGKAVGIAGILGGLAISLLRAQLGTPGSWFNEMLTQRMRARPPVPDPHAGDTPHADAPANTTTRPPQYAQSTLDGARATSRIYEGDRSAS